MTFAARSNMSNPYTVTLPDSIDDLIVNAPTASLRLYVNSSGSWSTNGTFALSGTWLTGVGTGSNYWVNFALTGDTVDSPDNPDTWLQLNTNRSWGRTIPSNTSAFITATLTFSTDSSGSTIVGSTSVSLSLTTII